MSRFELRPSRFFAEVDGETKLDSDNKPIARFPRSTWIETTQNVVFPNYEQTFAYSFIAGTPYEAGFLTFYPERCSTTGRIVDQEWGPDAAGGKSIPDIDLGALPDGCNWLEVFARITRTAAPDDLAGMPFPTRIASAELQQLLGGTCIVEEFAGTGRLFEIVIDDGRAVLRRYQTAKNLSIPTHLIEDIDHYTIAHSVGALELRQGDSNHCSFVPTADYGATYSAALSIRPCFVKPD